MMLDSPGAGAGCSLGGSFVGATDCSLGAEAVCSTIVGAMIDSPVGNGCSRDVNTVDSPGALVGSSLGADAVCAVDSPGAAAGNSLGAATISSRVEASVDSL